MHWGQRRVDHPDHTRAKALIKRGRAAPLSEEELTNASNRMELKNIQSRYAHFDKHKKVRDMSDAEVAKARDYALKRIRMEDRFRALREEETKFGRTVVRAILGLPD